VLLLFNYIRGVVVDDCGEQIAMKVLWGVSLGSVSSLTDIWNEGFVDLWTKFIVVIPHLWGMK